MFSNDELNTRTQVYPEQAIAPIEAVFHYQPQTKGVEALTIKQAVIGPQTDYLSKMLLSLKNLAKPQDAEWKQEDNKKCAAFFLKILMQLLGVRQQVSNTECLVVIPSSSQGNTQHGMTHFARDLSQIAKIPFNEAGLKRTQSLESAHRGGPRNADMHQKTMVVDSGLKNKEVLLLDDVITTGSSRAAAIALLKTAKVKAIWFLALGKTLSEINYYNQGLLRLVLVSPSSELSQLVSYNRSDNYRTKVTFFAVIASNSLLQCKRSQAQNEGCSFDVSIWWP